MGILSKLATIKAGIDSLEGKGMRGIASDQDSSVKARIKDMAKLGAVRLAKKTWSAAGGDKIDAFNFAGSVVGKGLDHVNAMRGQAPAGKSNKPQLEDKTSGLDKTRQIAQESQTKLEQKQQLRISDKSYQVTESMADDVKAIKEMMRQGSSPLTPKPFGQAAGQGGGGGILSTIMDGAGLLAKTKLGGKAISAGKGLLGKGAGLLSKLPGLGKLGKFGGFAAGATGLAGAAGTGAKLLEAPAKTAASVITKEGVDLVGKEALGKGVGTLASKVVPGAVTDVVAKTVGKEGAEAGAKVLGKEGLEVGGKALAKVAGKEALEIGGKTAGKSLLKKIPLIGAIMGAGFGAKRLWDGDARGAALELASGLASTVPVVGTAASLGLDGYLAYRDINGDSAKAEEEGQKKGFVDRALDFAQYTGPMGMIAKQSKDLYDKYSAPETPLPIVAQKDENGDTWNRIDSEALQPAVYRENEEKFAQPESPLSSIGLMNTFLEYATTPEKGIYVRPVNDPFSRNNDPFNQQGSPLSASSSGQDSGTTPQNVSYTPSPRLVEAPPGSVTPQLPGAGFVPNSQRTQSPRPYMGGGATPASRVDATSLTYGGDGSARASTPYAGTQMGASPGAKTTGRSGGVTSIGGGKAPIIPKSSKFGGFGADVDSHIAEASQRYGIDEKVLRGFVKMEGGWTGQMSPTGAIGTGQFIQSTWDGLSKTKEGQDIGMTRIGSRFRTEADPRRDKRTNTLATALLAKNNADMLRRNGLEATGENLYMMHNIGPGAINIMKGGNINPATRLAIDQNGGKGMSPEQFIQFQKGRYNSHYAAANAENVLAQANTGLGKAGDVKTAQTQTPSLKPPAVSTQQQQSQGLASSQSQKDAQQARPIVVAAAAPQESKRGNNPSVATGDTKPPITVRNNDSSIRRVTDNMISKTVT